jgi:hypothetical protein
LLRAVLTTGRPNGEAGGPASAASEPGRPGGAGPAPG